MADDNLVDFAAERSRRIHDLHERRLTELRDAFAAALPLPAGKRAKARGGKKKR